MVSSGSRRIRVLHVVQNLNYGGMERLIADMVLRSDPKRFECHVLVLQYLGRFAAGLEGHATLHVSPPLPRWSFLWPAALTRQIRRIAPDVLHSHSGVWYKSSLAAKHAGVPLIIHTEHGRRSPDPLDDRIIDHLASRRTDVVVAVSEVLADQLRRTVVHHRDRVCVVANGVDTQLYRPRPQSGRLTGELGLDPATRILGSIGRLESIKDYETMVRAFARLKSESVEGPATVLALVGDGSRREALEALAAELGVASSVHFLGWRDDIVDLLTEFTIFTMSSRSEGTSVSLLEAMSSGRCPVVTDVGGNGAVLGPELRHRLVRPGDPDALAAAWRAALEGDADREADATSARQRVEREFSLEAMVRQYESVYAGEHPVIAGRRPATSHGGETVLRAGKASPSAPGAG